VYADDNNHHSVNITTSSATNYTSPDKLDPNGSGVMPTLASYNSVSLAPASVASPLQTLYNPSTQTGTAAYTSYDLYGRVAYTLAPAQASGQNAGAQTTYTYSYGNPWTVTATTAGASGTHWTTQTLDGLGRVSKTQTGTGSTVISEVDTMYAPIACVPLGKVSQVSEPYPGTGTVVYTYYTYQAMGLTKTVTLADNSTTTYTYWGNATLAVDPANKWKLYFNDAFGNLVTVIEPDPTAIPVPGPPGSPPSYPVTTSNLPTGMLLTSYTYDMLNHLTQVSMPRKVSGTLQTQTRTFVYNPTTQFLTSATNPESGTVQYTYNSDGTMASKAFNNGNKETYAYDSYQRLQYIHRFPGVNEDTAQFQTFVYDSFNGASYPGMLMAATFASAVGPNQLTFQNQYTYTPAGNASSKTLYMTSANHSNDAASLTVNYGYDSQGVLLTESYPTTPPTLLSLTYTLDAMDRPTALTDSTNHSWVSGATYNPANRITGAVFPSGTETWVYNSLYQLTQRTTVHSSTTRLNMTYNYTAGQDNGQIASSVDGVSGETITYQYDALKRLASATGSGWSETYTYDGFGNMTGMTPIGGAPSLSTTVNWATNQITPTGVSYDGNGNVTAIPPSETLGYDVANRVVTVNGAQTYAYDSSNRRAYRNNGNDMISLYGAFGEKLGTYQITGFSGGAIQFTGANQNVYFAGRLISAESDAVAVDRLGSTRWSAASGGTSRTYYPYGVEYTATSNDVEKYATYFRDSTVNLDYGINRYYSSIWGRLTSPDPYSGSARVGSPGSWNRYAYSGDDPINRNDPTGLCDTSKSADPDKDCPNDGAGEGGESGGLPVCSPDDPICNQCSDGSTSDVCVTGTGKTPPDPTPVSPDPPDPTPSDPTDPIGPTPVTPPPPAQPPSEALKEVDACIYPDGIGISMGTWTLEVEYQLLVGGKQIFGIGALSSITISESVTKTSGNIDYGGGVWSVAGQSLNSHGDFWDVLAGNGTANQSFFATNATGALPVVTFGGATVLQNTYSSSKHTISVAGNSLRGSSATRMCGSQPGDPTTARYHTYDPRYRPR
jgi:RHS repeat-associated protein